MRKFDVVVIGAGPGGYEAASLLSKAGKSIAIIEKDEIGGTCLNEGCVPAKQYLESALYMGKQEYMQSCGVTTSSMHLDMAALKSKKDELIAQLKKGLSAKLKKTEVICGEASFASQNSIVVGEEEIGFEHCIIASGSLHRPHPTLEIDGKLILSSKEIFELQSAPKSILIVGGGAIGCEFATFFNSLGTQVSLAEFTPTLVPNEDRDVASTLERELKKKGISVHVNANVTEHTKNEDSILVNIQTAKTEFTQEFDITLVSIGRMPNTKSLNLKKAHIQSERDFITTNKELQTTNPKVYAIGDVVMSPALAHMAYHEASIVVDNILNQTKKEPSSLVPFVTFCQPQVASVGKNEKLLKAEGIEYLAKKQFFKSSAKAKIKGDDSGFIKLLTHKDSDTILGASIVGNDATELIHQLLIGIEKKLTCKELSKMIFAHPTLSESLWEMVN